jgi:uroporphyrinogen III methyltransferase/synthase
LTLRGAECIRSADVIVYDYLASPTLLRMAPKTCERIYVGKKGGEGSAAKQDDINAYMVAKALEGKKVVRLKGGDPFVFGRGGEEAETLAAAGVAFEIVPGVTSAVAVPAYAGIPLTHRSHSSSFCVITGHEDPAKERSSIPWKALALGSSTLVFLMGVRRLPDITAGLIGAGMDAGTPAALVRWGCTSRQETLVSDLAGIAGTASAAGLKPPAVLVVGSVVELRSRLSWFERRPLFGKTVLVTRAREQAGRLSDSLRALGANAIELPVIEFRPPENTAPLDSAIERIGEYDWLVFTSANGVRWMLKRVGELGGDVRTLAGPRVAAIGPATQRALRGRGINVEGIPSKYVAEELVSYLSGKDVRGSRILVARAQEARPALVKGLVDLGASVDQVACYRTVQAEPDASEVSEMLTSGRVDMMTFTSSSTVTCALRVLGVGVPREVIEAVPSACIGPVTARTARAEALKVSVVAREYTVEGLVGAILEHYLKEAPR